MCTSKTWVKAFALVFGLCGAIALSISPAARAQTAPRYKLDGDWPKTLPINWTIQAVTGIFADKNDHIWVLNRPRDLDKTENFAMLTPPTAECCVTPPAVLEFDIEGNLLKSWGVPGSVPGWPGSEHTIFTDKEGNVRIGGSSAGDTLMKFTADGKFISEFAHPGPAVAAGDKAQRKQHHHQNLLLFRELLP